MLRIINGTNIEYTKDDTFSMGVSSKNELEEGSQLRFIVARSETSEPIIYNLYDLVDGKFTVTLSNEDKEKLSINPYIYKLTLLSANGSVMTQKSGEFIVKWGA